MVLINLNFKITYKLEVISGARSRLYHTLFLFKLSKDKLLMSRRRNQSTASSSKGSAHNNSSSSSDFSNQEKANYLCEKKSKEGKPWNLKITSWNINGLRAWCTRDSTLSYVLEENPDILCIQEVRCHEDSVPKAMDMLQYYRRYITSSDEKRGYSGVGIYTRVVPHKVTYGLGKDVFDNEGRLITAEFESFYLINSYVPNSGRGLVRLPFRMSYEVEFLEYINRLNSEKPVILCGDLNVAHEEIDIANPKSNRHNAGFTNEEREKFSILLRNGYFDSFRDLYPNAKGAYTFWSTRSGARQRNIGWRLDYFVLSEALRPKLCDSVIRSKVLGSDHCPITLFMSV